MPVGWNGSDPAATVDADNYALGTAFKANEDVTLTHVRVWAGASEGPFVGTRTGKIWSTGGQELASVTLPADLPTGWSAHELSAPVERLLNQQWIVAFDTGPNYGFLNHGLDADVPSADGGVTALGFAGAPSGINGRFHVTPGEFPAQGNAQHAFYGADVQYELGIGGNTPPEITSIDVAVVGNQVDVLVNVTDAESLTGATVRYDWGDFTAPSASNYPDVTESHTYAVSGVYAILVSVTDSDGAVGYASVPVQVETPVAGVDGFDITLYLDAMAAHASRLGGLERLLLHEPKTAQTQGISAALWFNTIDPVPGLSGLASSSYRLEFVLRLYDNMLREPADIIDADMVRLVNRLFNAYCNDFTLGGLVHSVDLLAAYGPGLRVAAGYIPQDGKLMRAVSIYIPLLVADAHGQEA